MTFVPHTEAERREMLARIGVSEIEDLFQAIPASHRFPTLELSPPISELEIVRELQHLADDNLDVGHMPCFLGAGAYHHFIPAVVDHVISRSEFYTAYTPYQAEISQGTLQAIFEYQTMICELTGMAVSNASHYDGATALAEAAVMALSATRGKRNRVVMAPTIHPEYRQVVRTYIQGMGIELVGDEGLGSNAPRTDLEALIEMVDEDTACLMIQTPTFLGEILDLEGVARAVHDKGAILVVVCNPISLGMLKPPGAFDADIVLGEGQALGNALNFGGPYLGFFACQEKYVRRMAGRLVGETVDTEGRRGYVLTLSTREQHIRRERATSNICTNQGLNALAAAVYMSALGRCGLAQVSQLCYHKAHHAAEAISVLDGYHVDLTVPFFHEFVVRCDKPVADINRRLLYDYDLLGGYDLGQTYPELAGHMLLCVTEMNTADEIAQLVEALEEIAR
jgi:glycine dehydrogenase subunit 1